MERKGGLGQGALELQSDPNIYQSEGSGVTLSPEAIQQIKDNILERWRTLPPDEQAAVMVEQLRDVLANQGDKIVQQVLGAENSQPEILEQAANELKPLTQRQHKALTFISDYVDEKGYPPTLTEVQNYFGFAVINTASQLVTAIQKKGYIEREKNKPRTLKVLVPPLEARVKSIQNANDIGN